jgi:hypothetical protein
MHRPKTVIFWPVEQNEKKMNPKHVNGILSSASFVADVNGRFGVYPLDESFLRLQCFCGGDEFTIVTSKYPQAKSICSSCGREITLYDIALYPCGAGYEPEKDHFTAWEGSGNAKAKAYNVFVAYEYSEDAENDEDISWFVMVAQNPMTGALEEVMNDETA